MIQLVNTKYRKNSYFVEFTIPAKLGNTRQIQIRVEAVKLENCENIPWEQNTLRDQSAGITWKLELDCFTAIMTVKQFSGWYEGKRAEGWNVAKSDFES